MIRIAFVWDRSGAGWLGGLNYFRNLLSAVSQHEHSLQPVLFVGRTADSEWFSSFPPMEVVRTSVLDRGSVQWLIRKVVNKIARRDWVLNFILSSNRIGVLSHYMGLGKHSKIRSIAWYPDFQHVHYPDFFTEADLRIRNQELRDMVRLSNTVILSSEDARKDFLKMFPGREAQTAVLQFVVQGIKTPLEEEANRVLRQYEINGDFFYVPNQFWAHKNHRIIVDALAVLKKHGVRLEVISTGNTVDHRNPLYFQEFEGYLQQQGVADQFRILGVVPYDHIHTLMDRAVAIINPSLFEGWSTTVEEAKSLGKQVILSDIAVHREQNPQRAYYFSPQNAEALADSMQSALRNFDSSQESNHQRAAQELHAEKIKEFASRYAKIVLATLNA
ncbi:MAG: glycosyltransferase family 1 protein [Pseudomonadota bacterium]